MAESNYSGRINKDTLIPVGVVVAIIVGIASLVWTAATDRTFIMQTLRTHDDRLGKAEVMGREMMDSLWRIELRLGTNPHYTNPTPHTAPSISPRRD